MQNKFGLSRHIPETIKLKVRKQCGFGCIICGFALYEYEHLDPPFSECKAHSENGIVLLCVSCHAKVTRHFYSKEFVKSFVGKPKAKELGYSSEFFHYCGATPKVKLGSSIFDSCSVPISVGGVPLIKFSQSSEPESPFEISAAFYDKSGKPALTIDKNNWKISSGMWDATLSSGTLIIKDSDSSQCLKMRLVDSGFVEIMEMDMNFLGRSIQVFEGSLQVQRDGKIRLSMKDSMIRGFGTGIQI